MMDKALSCQYLPPKLWKRLFLWPFPQFQYHALFQDGMLIQTYKVVGKSILQYDSFVLKLDKNSKEYVKAQKEHKKILQDLIALSSKEGTA